MDLGLKGRAAAVGAASKGIGRATALELAREGADVAICARGGEALRATAAEIQAFGVRVRAVEVDLSERGAGAAFIDGATAAFGRLDIVVPNAGGPPPGGALAFDDDAYRAALELNLLSTIGMCRAAVAHMRVRGWGRICAIESSSVKQPIDGLALSNTTRAGVAGFLKTLATELAPEAITVNTVLPGLTLTDRVLSFAGENRDQAVLDAMAQMVPMRRIGTPEELAAAIVFLCSERASFITGAILQVDGGTIKGLL